VSLKPARSSAPWRQNPGLLRQIIALRAYTHGRGYADDPAHQEARIREGFRNIFGSILQGAPDGMFAQATEELMARILDEMRQAAEQQRGGA
jgi:hypothetical protein